MVLVPVEAAKNTPTPTVPTVTNSVIEEFTRENIPENVTVYQVPASAGAGGVTKALKNLTHQDAALNAYEVKNATDSVKYYGRLVVRSCPKHRYGIGCAQWCPDCLNTGECHPRSGGCVCAPGTHGNRCQDYCGRGRYGDDCSKNCSAELRGRERADLPICDGLTVCTHDLQGCSCLPGFMRPYCNIVCPDGWYGPSCALRCNYCVDRNCSRDDGRCLIGCRDPALCTH
ncbi:multiple epidermal growth factor-like domains protein 10, partial [Hyalella azteca]|uniref:Multiple epidermal growth factor-like domains protein 10 n=1 Tax=Hyalella azteca TaxID=294128 RepID=A0A979FUD5_HYAAZ